MSIEHSHMKSLNAGCGLWRSSICLFIMVIATTLSSGFQNSYSIIYLCQKPPSDTAKIFAPEVISTNYHEHSRLVQSNDGSEFYWAVVIANEIDRDEEQKIWYTRRNNNEWSKPGIIPLPFTEVRSPALSPDGLTLYFLTNDPDSDPDERPAKSILWATQMSDTSWSNIQRVDGILPQRERKMIMSYCFASNGNLYFDMGGPDENGRWSWRIYFSEWQNGKYLDPQLMGSSINEGRVCQYPFIANDESYLIFSSDREGTFGSGDLYISYRSHNGEWSIPVNMGETINTSSQERSPSVSVDGHYLFFTRHNEKTYQDFYYIDAKIIDMLKPNE